MAKSNNVWFICMNLLPKVLSVMLILALPNLGFAQTEVTTAGEGFVKAIMALSAVYAAANEDARSPECKSSNWPTYDVHRLVAEEISRLKPEYVYGETTNRRESIVDSLVNAPNRMQNGTTLTALTRSQAHKNVNNYVKTLKDLAPLTRCGIFPGYYANWIKNLQAKLRPYQQ